MQPKKDSFSIVILGAWNPSIFSPEWVSRHLSETGECSVKLAFPVSDPTAPRKITFEGIHLFPGRKQVMLVPDEPSLEGMSMCAGVLLKIIEALHHTPVSSAGINFSFLESEELGGMSDVLVPADTAKILDTHQVKHTSISRVLHKDGESNILNFSLAQENGDYALTFNFHYDFNRVENYQGLFGSDASSDASSDAISNAISKHYQEALDLSAALYGVQPEIEDD